MRYFRVRSHFVMCATWLKIRSFFRKLFSGALNQSCRVLLANRHPGIDIVSETVACEQARVWRSLDPNR